MRQPSASFIESQRKLAKRESRSLRSPIHLDSVFCKTPTEKTHDQRNVRFSSRGLKVIWIFCCGSDGERAMPVHSPTDSDPLL